MAFERKKRKFKVGEVVTFIVGGMLGNEAEKWWEDAGLQYGEIYTVSNVDDDGYIRLKGCHYWHHPGHFLLTSKYYQIKARGHSQEGKPDPRQVEKAEIQAGINKLQERLDNM